jgi:hypothetical protein
MNTSIIPPNDNEQQFLTFQASLSRRFPAQKLKLGKAEKRWAQHNGSFRPETHTPLSLLAEIRKGHSFTSILGGCSGLHCGRWCTEPECKDLLGHCGRPAGYRVNRHFQSAQYLPLDFDTGDERSSLGYLLANPFILEHGSFLYTTLSHTEASPKCRAVFITDLPFTVAEDYRRAKQALMARFPWGDASVNDPGRFFYGAHPDSGQSHYLGNTLPRFVVEELVRRYRVVLEKQQTHRALPQIDPRQIMGNTPAERYVNAAIQQEALWVTGRIEGTGERHRDLLVAAMKLGSLKLSPWLPEAVREAIDPYAVLLPAARENGYAQKYGEDDALRAIHDGLSYATPRAAPVRKPSAFRRRPKPTKRDKHHKIPIPYFEVHL